MDRGAERPAKFHILAVCSLTALNLAVCWRLFQVEYMDEFRSIEGSFIAIARYISRHWGDFSWFPLWHCGMPYQDTYVPALHLVVAVVATLGKISAARAYHGVTAVTYALGPATLYWMAVRMGSHRAAAFLAALFYSLYSPAALLMPDVARDLGGLWSARRLQVLTVYGEGPHVTAMTIAPLALLALENALRRRSGRALVPAAVAIALVFLTNVPGTGALGLAVFCWICAQPAGRRVAAWAMAGSAAVFAYGLACYGAPPSALATVSSNMGSMHPDYTFKYGSLLLVAALAAVAGAGQLLARTRLTLTVRFGILFFGLMAGIVLANDYRKLELVPQPHRMQLEMEMAACLLLGSAAWAIYTRIPRWIRPVVWVACLAPLAVQFDHYRTEAQLDTQPVDVASRSEYTTARWLDANLHGRRVYADGSLSFWLNAFSDTPQMEGCCLQGQSMPALDWVRYLAAHDADPADTERTKPWLQALGVDAMVVSGPESTDGYKNIPHPERFGRVFPVLHQEHGDTIYAVPRGRSTLAHVLRAEEVIPRRPNGQVDYSEVVRFAGTVSDDSRPAAGFEWLRGDTARIRANLRPGDVVSVQVAWFRGWKASVGGRQVPVAVDGLGFIAIRPECEGDCEIVLHWAGRPDWPLAAVVSAASLGLAGVLVGRRKARCNNGAMTAAMPEVKPRYQFKPGAHSSHTLLLAQFPELGEGRSVLDIGCAAGYLSEILAQRGFSVASIDWPGTPHPATVEFSGADLDDGLGPVERYFDYIICADVIEHLRDPLRLLKECRERLAPGGTLLASLPNSAHWYFRWNILLGRFPQQERGLFDSTHLHFYTWDGWVQLFDRAGLRIETVRSSAVPFGLAVPSWDGSALVRGLERLSVACARIRKTLFAYQFIVSARAR